MPAPKRGDKKINHVQNVCPQIANEGSRGAPSGATPRPGVSDPPRRPRLNQGTVNSQNSGPPRATPKPKGGTKRPGPESDSEGIWPPRRFPQFKAPFKTPEGFDNPYKGKGHWNQRKMGVDGLAQYGHHQASRLEPAPSGKRGPLKTARGSKKRPALFLPPPGTSSGGGTNEKGVPDSKRKKVPPPKPEIPTTGFPRNICGFSSGVPPPRNSAQGA
ncbi:basic salivary proline-rich protein 2-like [Penaeus monodon]|uniref:basic salivary proline-rich protein 2-like n=1 Tax=Penaeus monodon TaxID=6687 RepID=UPI0018A7A885|nr:basic salivary proline-rich protein 2-like [Penaeus monodon]